MGLGYVGLPLATELANFFYTVGYDLSSTRIKELKSGFDRYNLIKKKKLKNKNNLKFFNNPSVLKNADFVIVTVPTPVNKKNIPDLSFLKKACIEIGENIKKNTVIVFESTVYPGATREFCIPIIEKVSKLKLGKNLFIGYSPERISVGDSKYTLKKIIKIISGDSKKTIKILKYVYSKILKNKLYFAESLEVAELAKVFENTQRDLNISLVNELSIICNKLNINTNSVIKAASTKSNFIKFTPGLVGGHCISVDPYYLSYKSKKLGYSTKVINAGRLVNNQMPNFIFNNIKKKFNNLNNKKIIILGLTFKENCNDIRNSKIFDLIQLFENEECKLYLHDPYALKAEVKAIYKKKILKFENLPKSDVVILSLKHNFYLKLGVTNILNKLKKNGVFVDLKSTFDSKPKTIDNNNYFKL